ncbi:hypothetical protein [Arthrobacter sp. D1-17]
MSPALWSPVLRQLGSNWTYEAWDVAAGAVMGRVRNRLLEQDVVAANVTMPHKQCAAGTANYVTEDVQLSGACNLLVRRDTGGAGWAQYRYHCRCSPSGLLIPEECSDDGGRRGRQGCTSSPQRKNGQRHHHRQGYPSVRRFARCCP